MKAENITVKLRTVAAAISVAVCLGFLAMPWTIMLGGRP